MILTYVFHSLPDKPPYGFLKGSHGPSSIVQFARVSPVWRAEVERLLYGQLHLVGPKSVILCFRTIASGRRGNVIASSS